MMAGIDRLARLYACAVVLTVIFAQGSAFGGDRATPEPLGFSQDGQWFGLLQSGVSDGSGFPYAEVTVVDVAKDRILSRLSRELVVEDDTAEASAAREKLLDEMRSELLGLGFALPPEPIRDTPEDNGSVTDHFDVKLSEGLSLTVDLSTIPLASGSDCDKLGVKTAGFALEFRLNDVSVAAAVDKRIPASRGCPLTYRLQDVHVSPDNSGNYRVAAVVGYERHGFEGPDLRYLVLTRVINLCGPR